MRPPPNNSSGPQNERALGGRTLQLSIPGFNPLGDLGTSDKSFLISSLVRFSLNRAFESYDPADPDSIRDFVQVVRVGIDFGLIKVEHGIEPIRLRTRVWEMAVESAEPCAHGAQPQLRLPPNPGWPVWLGPVGRGKTEIFRIFERQRTTRTGRKI